jgi:hypothetical protein
MEQYVGLDVSLKERASAWWIKRVRPFGKASVPLDLPLHADLGLLAQRGRGVLCQTLQPPPPARRVPFAGRRPGRDQPVPRRAQPKPQALRLDRRPAASRGYQVLDSIH